MKRPSHFMLLFLILVGTPLFLWGETPPRAGKGSGKRAVSPPPRLIDRGKLRDGLAAEPASRPLRGDGHEAAPGPWTVFGTVSQEVRNARSGSLTVTVAGVNLELIPLGPDRSLPGTVLGSLRGTIAGPNGGFRWVGLLPGAYRLRALPDPERSDHLPVAVDVELPPVAQENAGERRFCQNVTLPYARTLKGSILTRTRSPRPGLTIRVSETGLLRGTAVSGDDGRFEIRGVGRGPFKIEVRDDAGKTLPVGDIQTGKDAAGDPRVEVAVLLP